MKKKKDAAPGKKKDGPSAAKALKDENSQLKKQLRESNDRMARMSLDLKDKLGIDLDHLSASLTSGCTGDLALVISAMQQLSAAKPATVTHEAEEDTPTTSAAKVSPKLTEKPKLVKTLLGKSTPKVVLAPISRRSMLFKTNKSIPIKVTETVDNETVDKKHHTSGERVKRTGRKTSKSASSKAKHTTKTKVYKSASKKRCSSLRSRVSCEPKRDYLTEMLEDTNTHLYDVPDDTILQCDVPIIPIDTQTFPDNASRPADQYEKVDQEIGTNTFYEQDSEFSGVPYVYTDVCDENDIESVTDAPNDVHSEIHTQTDAQTDEEYDTDAQTDQEYETDAQTDREYESDARTDATFDDDTEYIRTDIEQEHQTTNEIILDQDTLKNYLANGEEIYLIDADGQYHRLDVNTSSDLLEQIQVVTNSDDPTDVPGTPTENTSGEVIIEDITFGDDNVQCEDERNRTVLEDNFDAVYNNIREGLAYFTSNDTMDMHDQDDISNTQKTNHNIAVSGVHIQPAETAQPTVSTKRTYRKKNTKVKKPTKAQQSHRLVHIDEPDYGDGEISDISRHCQTEESIVTDEVHLHNQVENHNPNVGKCYASLLSGHIQGQHPRKIAYTPTHKHGTFTPGTVKARAGSLTSNKLTKLSPEELDEWLKKQMKRGHWPKRTSANKSNTGDKIKRPVGRPRSSAYWNEDGTRKARYNKARRGQRTSKKKLVRSASMEFSNLLREDVIKKRTVENGTHYDKSPKTKKKTKGEKSPRKRAKDLHDHMVPNDLHDNMVPNNESQMASETLSAVQSLQEVLQSDSDARETVYHNVVNEQEVITACDEIPFDEITVVHSDMLSNDNSAFVKLPEMTTKNAECRIQNEMNESFENAVSDMLKGSDELEDRHSIVSERPANHTGAQSDIASLLGCSPETIPFSDILELPTDLTEIPIDVPEIQTGVPEIATDVPQKIKSPKLHRQPPREHVALVPSSMKKSITTDLTNKPGTKIYIVKGQFDGKGTNTSKHSKTGAELPKSDSEKDVQQIDSLGNAVVSKPKPKRHRREIVRPEGIPDACQSYTIKYSEANLVISQLKTPGKTISNNAPANMKDSIVIDMISSDRTNAVSSRPHGAVSLLTNSLHLKHRELGKEDEIAETPVPKQSQNSGSVEQTAPVMCTSFTQTSCNSKTIGGQVPGKKKHTILSSKSTKKLALASKSTRKLTKPKRKTPKKQNHDSSKDKHSNFESCEEVSEFEAEETDGTFEHTQINSSVVKSADKEEEISLDQGIELKRKKSAVKKKAKLVKSKHDVRIVEKTKHKDNIVKKPKTGVKSTTKTESTKKKINNSSLKIRKSDRKIKPSTRYQSDSDLHDNEVSSKQIFDEAALHDSVDYVSEVIDQNGTIWSDGDISVTLASNTIGEVTDGIMDHDTHIDLIPDTQDQNNADGTHNEMRKKIGNPIHRQVAKSKILASRIRLKKAIPETELTQSSEMDVSDKFIHQQNNVRDCFVRMLPLELGKVTNDKKVAECDSEILNVSNVEMHVETHDFNISSTANVTEHADVMQSTKQDIGHTWRGMSRERRVVPEKQNLKSSKQMKDKQADVSVPRRNRSKNRNTLLKADDAKVGKHIDEVQNLSTNIRDATELCPLVPRIRTRSKSLPREKSKRISAQSDVEVANITLEKPESSKQSNSIETMNEIDAEFAIGALFQTDELISQPTEDVAPSMVEMLKPDEESDGKSTNKKSRTRSNERQTQHVKNTTAKTETHQSGQEKIHPVIEIKESQHKPQKSKSRKSVEEECTQNDNRVPMPSDEVVVVEEFQPTVEIQEHVPKSTASKKTSRKKSRETHIETAEDVSLLEKALDESIEYVLSTTLEVPIKNLDSPETTSLITVSEQDAEYAIGALFQSDEVVDKSVGIAVPNTKEVQEPDEKSNLSQRKRRKSTSKSQTQEIDLDLQTAEAEPLDVDSTIVVTRNRSRSMDRCGQYSKNATAKINDEIKDKANGTCPTNKDIIQDICPENGTPDTDKKGSKSTATNEPLVEGQSLTRRRSSERNFKLKTSAETHYKQVEKNTSPLPETAQSVHATRSSTRSRRSSGKYADTENVTRWVESERSTKSQRGTRLPDGETDVNTQTDIQTTETEFQSVSVTEHKVLDTIQMKEQTKEKPCTRTLQKANKDVKIADVVIHAEPVKKSHDPVGTDKQVKEIGPNILSEGYVNTTDDEIQQECETDELTKQITEAIIPIRSRGKGGKKNKEITKACTQIFDDSVENKSNDNVTSTSDAGITNMPTENNETPKDNQTEYLFTIKPSTENTRESEEILAIRSPSKKSSLVHKHTEVNAFTEGIHESKSVAHKRINKNIFDEVAKIQNTLTDLNQLDPEPQIDIAEISQVVVDKADHVDETKPKDVTRNWEFQSDVPVNEDDVKVDLTSDNEDDYHLVLELSEDEESCDQLDFESHFESDLESNDDEESEDEATREHVYVDLTESEPPQESTTEQPNYNQADSCEKQTIVLDEMTTSPNSVQEATTDSIPGHDADVLSEKETDTEVKHNEEIENERTVKEVGTDTAEFEEDHASSPNKEVEIDTDKVSLERSCMKQNNDVATDTAKVPPEEPHELFAKDTEALSRTVAHVENQNEAIMENDKDVLNIHPPEDNFTISFKDHDLRGQEISDYTEDYEMASNVSVVRDKFSIVIDQPTWDVCLLRNADNAELVDQYAGIHSTTEEDNKSLFNQKETEIGSKNDTNVLYNFTTNDETITTIAKPKKRYMSVARKKELGMFVAVEKEIETMVENELNESLANDTEIEIQHFDRQLKITLHRVDDKIIQEAIDDMKPGDKNHDNVLKETIMLQEKSPLKGVKSLKKEAKCPSTKSKESKNIKLKDVTLNKAGAEIVKNKGNVKNIMLKPSKKSEKSKLNVGKATGKPKKVSQKLKVKLNLGKKPTVATKPKEGVASTSTCTVLKTTHTKLPYTVKSKTKAFQTRQKLLKKSVKTKKPKDSWYQCSYCNYWTTHREKYKRHYLRHHKRKVQSYKVNPMSSKVVKASMAKRRLMKHKIVGKKLRYMIKSGSIVEKFIREELVSLSSKGGLETSSVNSLTSPLITPQTSPSKMHSDHEYAQDSDHDDHTSGVSNESTKTGNRSALPSPVRSTKYAFLNNLNLSAVPSTSSSGEHFTVVKTTFSPGGTKIFICRSPRRVVVNENETVKLLDSSHNEMAESSSQELITADKGSENVLIDDGSNDDQVGGNDDQVDNEENTQDNTMDIHTRDNEDTADVQSLSVEDVVSTLSEANPASIDSVTEYAHTSVDSNKESVGSRTELVLSGRRLELKLWRIDKIMNDCRSQSPTERNGNDSNGSLCSDINKSNFKMATRSKDNMYSSDDNAVNLSLISDAHDATFTKDNDVVNNIGENIVSNTSGENATNEKTNVSEGLQKNTQLSKDGKTYSHNMETEEHLAKQSENSHNGGKFKKDTFTNIEKMCKNLLRRQSSQTQTNKGTIPLKNQARKSSSWSVLSSWQTDSADEQVTNENAECVRSVANNAESKNDAGVVDNKITANTKDANVEWRSELTEVTKSVKNVVDNKPVAKKRKLDESEVLKVSDGIKTRKLSGIALVQDETRIDALGQDETRIESPMTNNECTPQSSQVHPVIMGNKTRMKSPNHQGNAETIVDEIPLDVFNAPGVDSTTEEEPSVTDDRASQNISEGENNTLATTETLLPKDTDRPIPEMHSQCQENDTTNVDISEPSGEPPIVLTTLPLANDVITLIEESTITYIESQKDPDKKVQEATKDKLSLRSSSPLNRTIIDADTSPNHVEDVQMSKRDNSMNNEQVTTDKSPISDSPIVSSSCKSPITIPDVGDVEAKTLDIPTKPVLEAKENYLRSFIKMKTRKQTDASAKPVGILRSPRVLKKDVLKSPKELQGKTLVKPVLPADTDISLSETTVSTNDIHSIEKEVTVVSSKIATDPRIQTQRNKLLTSNTSSVSETVTETGVSVEVMDIEDVQNRPADNTMNTLKITSEQPPVIEAMIQPSPMSSSPETTNDETIENMEVEMPKKPVQLMMDRMLRSNTIMKTLKETIVARTTTHTETTDTPSVSSNLQVASTNDDGALHNPKGLRTKTVVNTPPLTDSDIPILERHTLCDNSEKSPSGNLGLYSETPPILSKTPILSKDNKIASANESMLNQESNLTRTVKDGNVEQEIVDRFVRSSTRSMTHETNMSKGGNTSDSRIPIETTTADVSSKTDGTPRKELGIVKSSKVLQGKISKRTHVHKKHVSDVHSKVDVNMSPLQSAKQTLLSDNAKKFSQKKQRRNKEANPKRDPNMSTNGSNINDSKVPIETTTVSVASTPEDTQIKEHGVAGSSNILQSKVSRSSKRSLQRKNSDDVHSKPDIQSKSPVRSTQLQLSEGNDKRDTEKKHTRNNEPSPNAICTNKPRPEIPLKHVALIENSKIVDEENTTVKVPKTYGTRSKSPGQASKQSNASEKDNTVDVQSKTPSKGSKEYTAPIKDSKHSVAQGQKKPSLKKKSKSKTKILATSPSPDLVASNEKAKQAEKSEMDHVVTKKIHDTRTKVPIVLKPQTIQPTVITDTDMSHIGEAVAPISNQPDNSSTTAHTENVIVEEIVQTDSTDKRSKQKAMKVKVSQPIESSVGAKSPSFKVLKKSRHHLKKLYVRPKSLAATTKTARVPRNTSSITEPDAALSTRAHRHKRTDTDDVNEPNITTSNTTVNRDNSEFHDSPVANTDPHSSDEDGNNTTPSSRSIFDVFSSLSNTDISATITHQSAARHSQNTFSTDNDLSSDVLDSLKEFPLANKTTRRFSGKTSRSKPSRSKPDFANACCYQCMFCTFSTTDSGLFQLHYRSKHQYDYKEPCEGIPLEGIFYGLGEDFHGDSTSGTQDDSESSPPKPYIKIEISDDDDYMEQNFDESHLIMNENPADDLVPHPIGNITRNTASRKRSITQNKISNKRTKISKTSTRVSTSATITSQSSQKHDRNTFTTDSDLATAVTESLKEEGLIVNPNMIDSNLNTKTVKQSQKIPKSPEGYICRECGAIFTREDNLRRHMIVHTGSRPYRCHLCTFTATTEYNLKVHSRVHTGVKPYACPFCPYRANQHSTLRSHVYQHTGEKPLYCTLCDYRCRHASSLIDHVRRHHPV